VERDTKRDQVLDDYRAVMDIPAGRRLLWHITCKARAFHLSMTGNSWTFFNEGRRSVGLEVLDEMQTASRPLWRQIEDECAKPDAKDRNVEVKYAGSRETGRPE